MEKVFVFYDYDDIYVAAGKAGCRIGDRALLDYLCSPEEGRMLQEAIAYVPLDPRREQALGREVAGLWESGFVVRTKVGAIRDATYECSQLVEMAYDMTRVALEVKPDIIVVISGRDEFVPLVLELRLRGIRVEVCAFGSLVSEAARRVPSGFIDLDLLAGGASVAGGDVSADEVSYEV